MTATVVVFLKGVADFRFVALCVVYDFWSFAGEKAPLSGLLVRLWKHSSFDAFDSCCRRQ